MRHADMTMGQSERGRLGYARVRPARHDVSGFDRPPAILTAIRRWFERSRQRRALDQLDDRLLQDIGLTRLDIRHEIEKPFWRI